MEKLIWNPLNKFAQLQSDLLAKRPDLFKHFWVCFAASAIGSHYGLVGINLIGFGKEYLDSKKPDNKWDWLDILANFLGSLAGYGLNRLIFKII
jgi:hypothetical protein